MITAGNTTSASHPALVLEQPREPPSFHGSPSEDPEDWLEHVERVRLFNRWDQTETLRQVFFYLEESAPIWFENHESSLETWNNFRTQFLARFTTVLRKERAEVLLQTRTQHPNESFVVFAEEMKRFFRCADRCMAEEKKLRFLMRGVKEELFAGLVHNQHKTVAESATEASTIEKALEMRAKQYDRNFVGTANENYVDSMRVPADSPSDTIRTIVREELWKLLPTPPQPQVASLTDVREKLQKRWELQRRQK